MRENCTYGSMRGSRRKTAKSVLRVVEDRAGVPDKGRSALLYTLLDPGLQNAVFAHDNGRAQRRGKALESVRDDLGRLGVCGPGKSVDGPGNANNDVILT